MKRKFGPLFVVLFVLAGGTAEAATLSVSAPQSPRVGDTVTITTSGSTEEDSAVWTYYEPNGPDCAATQGDHSARVNTRSTDLRFPGAGGFNFNSQFQPDQATNYRLCAYLYYSGDNEDTSPPRAVATTVISVAPPPPPPDRDGDGKPDTGDSCPDTPAPTSDGCPAPPDQDQDGRPDNTDTCPQLAATTFDGCPPPVAPLLSGKRSQKASPFVALLAGCNQPCQLSATGKVDGRSLRRAAPVTGGPAARSLRLRVPASLLKLIRRQIKSGKKPKAIITVRAVFPSGQTLVAQRTITLRK